MLCSPVADGQAAVLLAAPKSRGARAALALLAVTVALGIGASCANAASYVVHSCNPNAGIPSTSGWTPWASGTATAASQNCATSGGGFAAAFSTTPGSSAGWRFTAPTDTDIAGFSLVRAFALPQNQPYGTGVYVAETSGSSPGFYTSYVNYGGAYYSGYGTESAGGLTGQSQLFVHIDCGGGSSCTGIGDAGLSFGSAAITLRDAINPVISGASGSLLAGGPLQGTKSISYGATDRGGGVHRAILAVDGATKIDKIVDTNAGTCANADAFTHTVPCKLSVSDTIHLDTTALSEGAHSIQLIVRDATNANEATYGPFSINVDNVPPPVNTSVPLIRGLARHGQTLVADTGTWTGYGIVFARQWQRFNAGVWQDIAGAMHASYAVQPADYGRPLRFRSRAANSEGTTDAYSDPTDPIASPTDPNGDLDGDGIVNRHDPDIDGDGIPNEADADPNADGGNGSNGRGGDAGGGGGSGGVPIQTQNGQGATAAAAIAAAFEGTKQRTITVKWGAKRSITGTLTQRTGTPIVGAKIDVTSTAQLMGAPAIPLGQVVTDSKGRFAYKLPAGVSRTIRFGYKAILEATSYAQTTDVVVQVTPKVTIRVDHATLRNKQAVTFKGKIAGAPAGVRKIVELHALDGKKWRIFASTRLARTGGSFKYRYRFMRTTRPTAYKFRAVVRAEKGWPFTTGQSRPAKVKVNP